MPQLPGVLRRRAADRLSCRPNLPNGTLSRPTHLRRRYLSAHVSPTAINVRPNVPPRNEHLYNALSELSKAAESYVNISRLGLALRGVGSHEPVMRLGVLSLGSQQDAQKVARLLLADPLGPVEGWEKQLEAAQEKPVLLKYGDESDVQRPSPLFKILPVPSRVLQRWNLEVLVSTFNVDTGSAPVGAVLESSVDTILDPKLQATSASGRPVPYPVHRTLVVGKGLESAVAFGRFVADNTRDLEDMVKVAVDLPAPQEEPTSDPLSQCAIVNVDIGTEALATFRTSIANSKEYEQGWFRSGVPVLSQWLAQGVQPSGNAIKPALRSLIDSVADNAEENITQEDIIQLQKLQESVADQETAELMLEKVAAWAERSHTELRDQVDTAILGTNWNKLAWWKLFWRVDDVTMITSEIIQQRWLIEAEKQAIYLAGQMDQAGFRNVIKYTPETIPDVGASGAAGSVEAPKETEQKEEIEAQEIKSSQTAISTTVLPPEPWHAQISRSRVALLAQSVAPMQALAQRLVLTSISTTSLSAALSALVYVSMEVSVFEASAIAALGLVWSLRRVQKTWEKARETWTLTVREQGRKTLKTTEEMVRWIISASRRRVQAEPEGVEERKRAREAVEKVRDALSKM